MGPNLGRSKRVVSPSMAAGPTITVTCSQEFRDGTKESAKAANMPMTEYVRQSVRLRQYLDEHGWTARCLRQAEGFVQAGAWRD